MSTFFMGRTTEREDHETVANLAGKNAGMLPELVQGEWVVKRVGIRHSAKVNVRDRLSLKV